MIPKIIHYCWFGRKPLPELAIKCISSWRKYLPDYEIKEWNEDNFDVNIISYTSDAYIAQKFAFVSDYARFWILYHYGGLYFDTDVEVIKPIDDIVARGAFMGCENEVSKENSTLAVAPGLGLGVNPGLSLYREILDYYEMQCFQQMNMETVVKYATNILLKHGLQNTSEIQRVADVWIYPKDFFCPINYVTKKCIITNNTRSIHHYAESWHGKKEKIYKILKKIFGESVVKSCVGLVRKYCFS